MSIVENIKSLCVEQETSIPKLEKELDLPKGSVYKWDKNRPSIDKLEKVANYFGVSIDHILGRDEKENLYQSDRDFIIKLLKKNGVLKDGEDISDENMERLISIINTTAEAFKK